MARRHLTANLAAEFVQIALGHVRREYPNKLDHVMRDAGDVRAPSGLHPIFYGSLDWHSCVHGYWMLARLLRRFQDLAQARAICDLFDEQIVDEKVAGECAYLSAVYARGFERPYGWAWLLKLMEELTFLPQRRWAQALAPLADIFAQRFRDFLPLAIYPTRVGAHPNTAFALRMAADYAAARQDSDLTALLRDAALRWYGADLDCPAWGEPGGEDFQSPALIEAECMRRLLPPAEFLSWFERFLPRIVEAQPATLFRPAMVTDRTDGKIAHLDGLNLSRAWCWRSLAGALPVNDPRRAAMEAAAERHLADSLPHVADDYMGAHWLPSFAVLALEA